MSSDVLAALQGATPRAMDGRSATPNPLTCMYRTSDGRHIGLMFLQPDRYWAELCRLLRRPDLAEDPRFADIKVRRENKEACMAELDAEFGKRTFEEAKALLYQMDAPWAPVQAVEELLDDPQVLANGYIGTVKDGDLEYRLPAVPVQFDEQPPPMRRAPEHGEHTEAILLEIGYTWDDIAALREAGVLA